MVETRVVNDRAMLPEVGEQNDNGENEKRDKKRRIKRSRRGKKDNLMQARPCGSDCSLV